MSKRVFLLGVGICALTLAFLLTDWLVAAPSGVTEANCRRIRVGMSAADVEAIFGGRRVAPPREETLIPYLRVVEIKTADPTSLPGPGLGQLLDGTWLCLDPDDSWLHRVAVSYEHWQGRGGYATVFFGARGQVVGARFHREERDLVQRLRSSFGR